MEESQSTDSIHSIRAKQQADLSNQRQKSRETAISKSRISGGMEITSDSSIDQIKNLSLEICQKRKKLDLQILKKIKNACCRPEFIEAFFKIAGAFDAVLNCLKQNDAKMQIEAVACLTNLACGPHKLCFKVAKAAGSYLVSFITGSSHFLQSQSAWAVRNIVNDCSECYAKLQAHGVYPALLKALKSPIPDVIESAVYALSACFKYIDGNTIKYSKEQLTVILLNLIEEKNLSASATREAALILTNSSYISISNGEECPNFNVDQLLRCIKKHLHNEKGDYLTALVLIRCLGYLTNSDWIAEHLLTNACFTEITVEVLNHPCLFLKKEFFWILTNISVSKIFDADHRIHTLILKTLEILLNPLDSAIFSIMYYICCSATQSESICLSYKQHGLLERIESLTNCGDLEVENVSKSCVNIIKRYIIL